MKVRSLGSYEEDAPKYFYRARHLRLEHHGSTFETPLRVLNNTDFNAKGNAPSTAVLRSPVSGIFKNLNRKEVEQLLTLNTASERLITSLDTFTQKMQYSDFIFASIQPPASAITTTLSSDSVKDKFLRMVFKVQKEAGLESLTVPWLRLSTEQTLEMYRRVDRESDAEPIFMLDASADPRQLKTLSEYLTGLIDTERIHMIGVRYRPVRKALASYDTMWEALRDKDVAVVLSEVPRYEQDSANLSGAHMNQFVLGDILATKVSRSHTDGKDGGAGGSIGVGAARLSIRPEKPSTVEELKEVLRFFDRRDLIVRPVLNQSEAEWSSRVLSELNEPQLKLALENYKEAVNDPSKLKALNAFSRVHETVTSQKEFELSRRFVGKGEAAEYLEGKETLSRSLRSTRRTK